MTGILVTGHGNFATGVYSSLKLVFGEQEQMCAVDFLEIHSTDDLKRNLLSALDSLAEDVLILCDVKGGSPYNQSVLLKRERADKQIEVLSGTNLGMLLTAVLSRNGCSLDELAGLVTAGGHEAVERFVLREAALAAEEDSEDGI